MATVEQPKFKVGQNVVAFDRFFYVRGRIMHVLKNSFYTIEAESHKFAEEDEWQSSGLYFGRRPTTMVHEECISLDPNGQSNTAKILTDDEKATYMKRLKSGESPVAIGDAIFRLPSFVSCKKLDERIIVSTKTENLDVFDSFRQKSITDMYSYIVKLMEAVELEDYDTFKTLQAWILKLQKLEKC